ncbi:MAG: T9SS type A sorting domain-containing protein [Candidatus Marinimicrobia bacterium]|nr:T9SS type A sorting domain-containing protein [Candidatus Neomarinimicrobiota bacterium]
MLRNKLFVLLSLVSAVFAGDLVALKKNLSHNDGPRNINSIRICALRVDFQQDDKEITSGSGKFLFEPETDDTLNSKFKIDPVPHNRAYFRDHILALANFYHHASNGKLTVDVSNSEVYPLNDEDTYTVSQAMDYYNPFLEEDSVDVRLPKLFIEGVQLADAEVNFADYDVVVIFHAGVGQDFAVELDPTPYDIPSVYLNKGDISKALGNPENFTGISVDNGNTLLDECIILPETQNHTLYEKWDEVFLTDNAFDVQVGLNGTFAFMFGFYLGIPGMYNTETGDAGVGRWGMMDQGSVNLNGLVPALPNAWVRHYLGWIDPAEAKKNQKVRLSHAESGADTMAWKIPIDEDEYFLVENRCNFLRNQWNLDSIRNNIYDELPADANFPSVLPLIRDSIGAVFSPETGVLLSVPRYDVGLPGSGLLIWHIDESVIEPNIATNSINNEREHRGVHLEEGDGAVDIGFPPASMFSDVHNGWGFDAWFAGNEGFWDVNRKFYNSEDSAHVGFTDYTFPNTRNNDDVYTGIAIDSIGQSGEVMEFVIEFAAKDGNFPVAFGSDVKAMDFCDIDNDGNEEIIVVSNKVYIYNAIGKLINEIDYSENGLLIDKVKVQCTDQKLFMVIQFGTRVKIQEYKTKDSGFALENEIELENSEVTSNSIYQNGILTFCVNNSTGFNILQIEDSEIKYSNTPAKGVKIGYTSENIYYLTEGGELITGDLDIQNSAWSSIDLEYDNETSQSLAIGHLSVNNHVVITTDNRLINVYTDLGIFYDVAVKCVSDPIISDINSDGKNDIVVASKNQIFAFDENLILLPNFPIELPNLFKDKEFDKMIYSADIDGDDKTLEIVVFIKDIGVAVFNSKGELVSGFPIATITPENEMSGLFMQDRQTSFLSIGNSIMNSVTLSDNSLDEKAWVKNGYDGNSYYYPYQPIVTVVEDDALLNKKKTFCWPNPVENNECYIRYWVNENCDLTINIFNMAGQFVKSFTVGSMLPGQYNEITWNVADIESGVYFAIIKAEKGSKTETETEKIMIIK